MTGGAFGLKEDISWAIGVQLIIIYGNVMKRLEGCYADFVTAQAWKFQKGI